MGITVITRYISGKGMAFSAMCVCLLLHPWMEYLESYIFNLPRLLYQVLLLLISLCTTLVRFYLHATIHATRLVPTSSFCREFIGKFRYSLGSTLVYPPLGVSLCNYRRMFPGEENCVLGVCVFLITDVNDDEAGFSTLEFIRNKVSEKSFCICFVFSNQIVEVHRCVNKGIWFCDMLVLFGFIENKCHWKGRLI